MSSGRVSPALQTAGNVDTMHPSCPPSLRYTPAVQDSLAALLFSQMLVLSPVQLRPPVTRMLMA